MVCGWKYQFSCQISKYLLVWATLAQGANLLLQSEANFYCLSPVRLNAKDAQMHVQAFSLRKYTSHRHLPDCSLHGNHDYLIILLYLGCMTSSGQIENSKLYNSVSFGPNTNRFGQFDQTTKRSISTKGIRNCGKFESSISVAQKWWCLGVSHHSNCQSVCASKFALIHQQ